MTRDDASTIRDGRAWAEYIGGTKMRFHYPCGYTSVKDFSKGALAKRLGETGVRMMASWWSKEKGGVIAKCPKKCKVRP